MSENEQRNYEELQNLKRSRSSQRKNIENLFGRSNRLGNSLKENGKLEEDIVELTCILKAWNWQP